MIKDVYDYEGNLLRLEFYSKNGEILVDAIWDERDAQTSENRIIFREWAKGMAESLGYDF